MESYHSLIPQFSTINEFTAISNTAMNARQLKFLNRMKDIAESKNGRLLSNYYLNNKTALYFECQYKHRWWTRSIHVSRGHWCKECGIIVMSIKNTGNNTYIFQARFAEFMTNKGGKILGEYVNARTPIDVCCVLGHVWKASPDNLINGESWCKQCIIVGIQIRLHNLVSDKGGKILGNYINTESSIKLQCEFNHIWEPIVANVLYNGHWCSICVDKTIPASQKLQIIVSNKGGKIIGNYTNNYTHIEIECDKGHRFSSVPTEIFRGYWCFKCNRSSGEHDVSKILELMSINFIEQFKHPLFQIHKSRYRYDFYFTLNNRNIILEYDGRQHFEYNSFFHKSKEEFNHKQDIDRMKTYVACVTGYYVIRIDYTSNDRIQECILLSLQSDNKIFVSSIQMYQSLLSQGPSISLIKKKCPSLICIFQVIT